MTKRTYGSSGTATAADDAPEGAREELELTDGRKLEIEVWYNLERQNSWQGTMEKRGYWLLCTPVRLHPHGHREYTVGSGMKSFLLEVRRESPKALRQARQLASLKKRALIEAVLAKNGLALANPQDLPPAPQEPIPAVSGVIAGAPAPKVPGMKLLTQEILAKLPPLGSQEAVEDPVVWAKFFDPCGSWTWYATEYDPAEGRFFGYVKGFESELGYFMLSELESARGPMGLGIERDRHFRPCRLSEIQSGAVS